MMLPAMRVGGLVKRVPHLVKTAQPPEYLKLYSFNPLPFSPQNSLVNLLTQTVR